MVRAAALLALARRGFGWNFVGGLLVIGFVGGMLVLQFLTPLKPASHSFAVRHSLTEIPYAQDLPVAEIAYAEAAALVEAGDLTQEEARQLVGSVSAADRRRFDALFAQFRARREAQVLAGGQVLLDVDFDLGAQDASSGELEVDKPVDFNGRRVGTVSVAIDDSSQLHLSSADLARLLPADIVSGLDAAGGYIAFDALRRGGLNIRYDAANDVLVIAS